MTNLVICFTELNQNHSYHTKACSPKELVRVVPNRVFLKPLIRLSGFKKTPNERTAQEVIEQKSKFFFRK